MFDQNLLEVQQSREVLLLLGHQRGREDEADTHLPGGAAPSELLPGATSGLRIPEGAAEGQRSQLL